MNSFGFIGCGNMGSALAAAVAKELGGKAVVLANRTQSKAERLAAELGAAVATNQSVAAGCAWIFLGVKPQMMPQLLEELAPALAARQDRFVLVTMAAGLSMERVRTLAGGPYPIIRILPNTPAAIGKGVIPYCCDGVTTQEEAAFCAAMAQAGLVDPLPEALIDAAGCVSGCGPAWVYQFLEALADGGVACGLPRDKALRYAAQTLAGSAELALQSGRHPGALKDAVCSPGGSTIQGVRVLEERGFRGAVMDAVIAAYDRTRQL